MAGADPCSILVRGRSCGALVEYENGGGGGGGGGVFEIQELRRDSPKSRSDSNFVLHNRSNLSNPTGSLQQLG